MVFIRDHKSGIPTLISKEARTKQMLVSASVLLINVWKLSKTLPLTIITPADGEPFISALKLTQTNSLKKTPSALYQEEGSVRSGSNLF